MSDRSDMYPISDALRSAFTRLFDDPSVPDGLLGNDSAFPVEMRIPPVEAGTSTATRATRLRARLESFVVQMAAELEELGPEEHMRLRAEAVATLVAIRELVTHFPEALPSPGRRL